MSTPRMPPAPADPPPDRPGLPDSSGSSEPPDLPDYAELCCLSNFSFQRGASHPAELVARAHRLGYAALALTDECSLAGVVRAHVAARALQFPLLIGASFQVRPERAQPSGALPSQPRRRGRRVPDDPASGPEAAAAPFELVLLARNRQGYGQLCELITAARTMGGERPGGDAPQSRAYRLTLADWVAQAPRLRDVLALYLPQRTLAEGALQPATLQALAQRARWVQARFAGRCWLGVGLHQRMDDGWWLQLLQQVGAATGLPLLAVGQVLMHTRARKPLQDVLTAVRLRRPVAECGFALQPNAQAYLRSRQQLAQLYPAALLAETARVAALCRFSLDELKYEYPQEVVPAGDTPSSYLRRCTYAGAGTRYPEGLPSAVQQQLEHELALIAELRYEAYFLTVYDIVQFARGQGILCQGRGSAANSAVCYCLGITEVDPARTQVLFERFISRERNEPPDIDVDFEHERREEVIQYLYRKYGRDRAALAAAVITYHARSALRDVGKALGIGLDAISRLSRAHRWWRQDGTAPERIAEAGLDPQDVQVRQWLELTQALIGFPRHLSQHSGGFVLTGQRLTVTVPVRQAAMPGRTTIEWDKDDLDALGLMKVDVLALGMLSAIRRSLALVGQWRGRPMRMQDIPAEDEATYDMICQADTIGVFQIESRAQQSMLPRLRPRKFYDLVIEVAIVRPGPIQGGMVHPYLRRRQGLESDGCVKDELRTALARTLGVPIFQEQVMQIAIIAANFSPGEADGLRRAMAAWKRGGHVDKYQQRLIEGMLAKGYPEAFAQAIFKQIEGFGAYGFPESHAASFALLAYVSAWLKRHEPACFLAALLNSQPMGFYGPSQLVQDAQRHGVTVLPADVQHSDWDCTLQQDGNEIDAYALPDKDTLLSNAYDVMASPTWPQGDAPQPAVRLGLRLVKGLGEADVRRVLAARATGRFLSTEDLALRAGLGAGALRALAAADALRSLSGHRRQQIWDASALQQAPPLLRAAPVHEATLALPAAPEGEAVAFDYAALGLSLRSHPLALLRPLLAPRRLLTAAQLRDLPDRSLVRACGLVVTRQQPGTAKGTVFVTLEDETGSVNVIVWARVRDRQRQVLVTARLLAVYGQWQRQGEVRHLVAGHLVDLSSLLGDLATQSRDFR